MRIWILKAVIQKLLSWLPMKHRLNYLFQKYVTKGVRLSDAYFDDKLEHAIKHLEFSKKFGHEQEPVTLELGTGWYPVVPLALLAGGTGKVTSIDLSSLMTSEGVALCAQKFKHKLETQELPKSFNIERAEVFSDFLGGTDLRNAGRETGCVVFSKQNEKSYIHQFRAIVGDASKMNIRNQSFDYIVSNNTLEHIYPEILLSILKEFRRVLKHDGIMSHFIDMSDHFAHLDRSISVYNYLKFSPKAWNFIDNSIQPQNRLRIYDYRRIIRAAGFEIIHEELRPGQPEQLEKLKIHKSFAKESLKETAVTHVYMVCKKFGGDLAGPSISFDD